MKFAEKCHGPIMTVAASILRENSGTCCAYIIFASHSREARVLSWFARAERKQELIRISSSLHRAVAFCNPAPKKKRKCILLTGNGNFKYVEILPRVFHGSARFRFLEQAQHTSGEATPGLVRACR